MDENIKNMSVEEYYKKYNAELREHINKLDELNIFCNGRVETKHIPYPQINEQIIFLKALLDRVWKRL